MREIIPEPLRTRVQLDLYDTLGWDLTEPPTNLYFIVGQEWVKVGLARFVEDRLATLQIGCPFKLKVAHKVRIPRAFSLQVERHTHRRLKAFAAHGEWFAVDVATAVSAATDIIAQVKALLSVIGPKYNGDWCHRGPPHTGADFIYLVGGVDIPEKRLLAF